MTTSPDAAFSDTFSFLSVTLAQGGVKPPSSDDVVATPVAGPAPAGSTPVTGTATATTPAPAPAAAPGGIPTSMLLMFVLVIGFVMLQSFMMNRREKKKRATLMSEMGKGDKVITIGGQIGVVDQVRDQEVVLKIDENSNVRARFSKASIQSVLESASKAAEASAAAPNIEVKAKSDSPVPAR